MDSSEKSKDNFTQDQITIFWTQYLEKLKSIQPVLYNVLNSTPCYLKENYTLFFEFPSNSAYDEFDHIREDFFQKIKKNLNNYSINFSFQIKETKKNILLSSKDKYEKMLEINPLLEKLKNEFRLDI